MQKKKCDKCGGTLTAMALTCDPPVYYDWCQKCGEVYHGNKAERGVRATRQSHEELLIAAKALLSRWYTLPFCTGDKGQTVCLDSESWRRFNYGEVRALQNVIGDIEITNKLESEDATIRM
jgi:hypothetical protein